MLSFSVYLIPFWVKILPEKGFLIFCYFFRNFVALVGYERNSRLKFFFVVLGQSHPVLVKNNAGKIFFEFFCYFFQNFLPRAEYERNSGLNFFFSFLANLIPFWQSIILERCYLIFWIFLLFFSEFSFSGRVWTEFGTKIFFSISQPISSRFG